MATEQAHPLGVTATSEPPSARQAVKQMLDAGLLDEVMDRVDAGSLTLTGEGGFLPEMVKAVLERGLQAELTEHLGYERGDPAGRGSPNSRNGSTPKTLATEVGAIGLDTPRDRAGSFEPRLVPKGARRAGGLDEMIVSLYAGGMTVRDIQHHLARTLGTELSHETISNITDAVLEEVKAWQGRPLEGGHGDPDLLDRVERRLLEAGVRRSDARSKLARLLGDRLPPPALASASTPRLGRNAG